MANLPEESIWEAGIYQIEQTDPVIGGAPNVATKAGLSNIPNQQLARRTVYLKEYGEATRSRKVTGSGLATGGGDLSQDRAINVPVATQAQAEAGVLNNVAMTPLTVKQAISGLSTASLAASGWQRLPSGLILQWGLASGTNGGSATFPMTFPTAVAQVLLSDQSDNLSTDNGHMVGLFSATRTGFLFTVRRSDGAAGQTAFSFFALGW